MLPIHSIAVAFTSFCDRACKMRYECIIIRFPSVFLALNAASASAPCSISLVSMFPANCGRGSRTIARVAVGRESRSHACELLWCRAVSARAMASALSKTSYSATSTSAEARICDGYTLRPLEEIGISIEFLPVAVACIQIERDTFGGVRVECIARCQCRTFINFYRFYR